MKLFPKRVSLSIALMLGVAISHAAQQPPSKEKPKLKDFGSSLKRLKWDPARKAPVESEKVDDKSNSATEDEVVRVETSLVVNNVLVLDARGQPVTGLTQADFLVREDDNPQQVAMFSLGDNVAISRSIVLIIDYSGSQFPFINMSVAAAKTLVDKLGPLDRMALVTDDVELIQDFTSDKGKLKGKLESLRRRTLEAVDPRIRRPRWGQSSQYSALMAVLKEAFDREDERPIVIFQTDGDEAIHLRDPIVVPSVPPGLSKEMKKTAEDDLAKYRKWYLDRQREFSLNNVYSAVQKSRATIYTVIPGYRIIGLPIDEQISRIGRDLDLRILAHSTGGPSAVGLLGAAKFQRNEWDKLPPEAKEHRAAELRTIQEGLAVVAPLTGGWTEFLEHPSQADRIYTRIYADISQRYLVGYYPTNKEHDGKRRTISIEVRGHPEYVVMSRKFYYAPQPEQ